MSESVAEARRVLTHPVRLEMIRTLGKSGKPMALGEMASRAGVDESLAEYHLLALSKAGLVAGALEVVKPPQSMGTAQRVYQVTPLTQQALDSLRAEIA